MSCILGVMIFWLKFHWHSQCKKY